MRKIGVFVLVGMLLMGIVSATYSPGGQSITYSSGNVGIGTSNPTQALHVEGSANITGNLTLRGFAINPIPNGAIMAFDSATCPSGWILADGTSGTPDLRGIFVRGSGVNGVIDYSNGSDMSATYGEYGDDSMDSLSYNFAGDALSSHTHSVNPPSTSISISDSGHTHGSGSLAFEEQSSTGSVTGTASRAGNTGVASGDISGSTASSTTGISGSVNIASFTSGGTSAGTPSGSVTASGANVGDETTPAYYAAVYCVKVSDDSDNVVSSIGHSGDSVYLLNTSKNFGIGTMSPSGRLEVAALGDVNTVRVTGNSTIYASLWIDNPTTDGPGVYLYRGDLIINNGDVGIGTTDPQAKLHVGDGTTSMSTLLRLNTSSGDYYASVGDGWATSDKRIKKDIVEIDNALDVVLRLRGVNFDWINPDEHIDGERRQTGFIAQEVEEILPEFVAESNTTGDGGAWVKSDNSKDLELTGGMVKSINMEHLDAYLVEAIKELKSENDLLKEELCSRDNSYSWC